MTSKSTGRSPVASIHEKLGRKAMTVSITPARNRIPSIAAEGAIELKGSSALRRSA